MKIRKKLCTAAAAIAAALTLGAGLAPGTAAAAGRPGLHVSAGHIRPDLSGVWCESFSPFLCPQSNSGEYLTENSGDLMNWHPNGNTFTWAGVTYNVGTLQNNNTGLCIGGSGLTMFDENCSTGIGTIWGLGSDGNGHTVWVNRKHTQDNGTLTVLAGTASTGVVVNVETWPPAPGVYERWTNNAS